jgi:hypothetical protein
MTSLQSQYLLCPPLSCNTALTHQQPKIATFGYFTWETGPWQQEKQHQCPRSPTNIGTDSRKPSPWKRITRQTSLLWHSTETSASTCKGPMVQQSKGLWPAKLEASLVQRWIKMHAAEKKWPYTCLQTPEWEDRKELRPSGRHFVGGSGVSYPTSEKLNWCTSPATLAPLDTDMRFWHHTCCPQWTSVWKFFSTTTFGRTQFVLLLTF